MTRTVVTVIGARHHELDLPHVRREAEAMAALPELARIDHTVVIRVELLEQPSQFPYAPRL